MWNDWLFTVCTGYGIPVFVIVFFFLGGGYLFINFNVRLTWSYASFFSISVLMEIYSTILDESTKYTHLVMLDRLSTHKNWNSCYLETQHLILQVLHGSVNGKKEAGAQCISGWGRMAFTHPSGFSLCSLAEFKCWTVRDSYSMYRGENSFDTVLITIEITMNGKLWEKHM